MKEWDPHPDAARHVRRRSVAGSALEWLVLGTKVLGGRLLLPAIPAGFLALVASKVLPDPSGWSRAEWTRHGVRCLFGAGLLAASAPLVAALLAALGRPRRFYFDLTVPEGHRLTDHMFPGTGLWRMYTDRPRATESWERPATRGLGAVLLSSVADYAVFWCLGTALGLVIPLPGP